MRIDNREYNLVGLPPSEALESKRHINTWKNKATGWNRVCIKKWWHRLVIDVYCSTRINTIKQLIYITFEDILAAISSTRRTESIEQRTTHLSMLDGCGAILCMPLQRWAGRLVVYSASGMGQYKFDTTTPILDLLGSTIHRLHGSTAL